MKVYNVKDFTRGWFIGNFNPSILKTDQFEVGYLCHKKGEVWPKHYHALAIEYSLLIKGKMVIRGTEINEGDIFALEPYEVADPEFLEDCYVLVVKFPSVIGDKYEVV